MKTGSEKTSAQIENVKFSLRDSIVRIWEHESNPPPIWVAPILILVVGTLAGMMMVTTGKPVIYLYPEYPMDVAVTLDYNGKLRSTYPKYDDG
jgi:hypothetical protein